MDNTTTLCSVDTCDRRKYSRGYCRSHYDRLRRAGELKSNVTRYSSREEAFLSRIEESGSCLVWTGFKNKDGYGQMWVGATVRVHRYAWERANGPIPERAVVDHICHNPACVKIEHLRLADRRENSRNRAGATAQSSTGVRNVYPRANGKFQVAFGVNNRMVTLGTYGTLEEAERVASAKRAELFGAFSGGGR